MSSGDRGSGSDDRVEKGQESFTKASLDASTGSFAAYSSSASSWTSWENMYRHAPVEKLGDHAVRNGNAKEPSGFGEDVATRSTATTDRSPAWNQDQDDDADDEGGEECGREAGRSSKRNGSTNKEVAIGEERRRQLLSLDEDLVNLCGRPEDTMKIFFDDDDDDDDASDLEGIDSLNRSKSDGLRWTFDDGRADKKGKTDRHGVSLVSDHQAVRKETGDVSAKVRHSRSKAATGVKGKGKKDRIGKDTRKDEDVPAAEAMRKIELRRRKGNQHGTSGYQDQPPFSAPSSSDNGSNAEAYRKRAPNPLPSSSRDTPRYHATAARQDIEKSKDKDKEASSMCSRQGDTDDSQRSEPRLPLWPSPSMEIENHAVEWSTQTEIEAVDPRESEDANGSTRRGSGALTDVNFRDTKAELTFEHAERTLIDHEIQPSGEGTGERGGEGENVAERCDSAEEDGFSDGILDPSAKCIAQNFIVEHRIFLKAILQLLTERDQIAVEADVNDPNTIIKSGPLKKASHLVRGIWKVRHVEIRMGILTYYEDDLPPDSNDDSVAVAALAPMPFPVTPNAAVAPPATPTAKREGKSVPLRASVCTCRAVKVRNRTVHNMVGTSGAIFELTVAGGPKRVWMANSREERQAWMSAIHEAMIGGSVTRRGNNLSYEGKGGEGRPRRRKRVPDKSDLELYMKVQKMLKKATSRDAYIWALSKLFRQSLDVPVQWIKEQIRAETSTKKVEHDAFHEGEVSSDINQLWKDMRRDSVSVNDVVIKGDSGHGPERIISALSRTILSFDASSPLNVTKSPSDFARSRITEAQAVSYACDVLLACNRTRSGGDSYFCVETLCSNSALVVLCPLALEAEPLSICVSHPSTDDNTSPALDDAKQEYSGWIMTRTTEQTDWMKRFAVLSDGVLTCFKKASPRPHGLTGQIIVAGASVAISKVGEESSAPGGKEAEGEEQSSDLGAKVDKGYVICILNVDQTKSRLIRIEDDRDFFGWNGALREAVEVAKHVGGSPGEKKPVFPNLDERARDDTHEGKRRRFRNFHKRNHSDDLLDVQQVLQNMGRELGQDGQPDDLADPELEGIEADKTDPTNSEGVANTPHKSRSRPSVEVSVHASSMYKLCTTDPQGDETEDNWATLRATFLQNFRLFGGVQGRLVSGEEIVQLNVLEGLVDPEVFDRAFSA